MKAITNLALTALCASAMVSTAFANAPEGWETNVETAIEIAKKDNKAVMLEFTGSDWCPPCKMMAKNVFSKDEFVSAASEKFVLVHLDFPKGDPELKKKNMPYAKEYKIEGYPTVILLDSEGKEFDRFFASAYPDVEKFLGHLDEALEKKDLD
ncbi:MAG: thioredoxin family protein [Akkermansiaceae bacterium]|jgi:thiol:disulfide interchange protein|nr:thioredoxin family protein [Akkermansiaceae bacterium]MDP4647915.1 thioredoxin family protein [Akkermansiaceae bacterium]MDP4719704.1 thioredoxin family protein [Akkermansiaceae bacterium]MDP4781259.1 thioredoxin family protein [Akkermansiaceae bacterium]MDP4846015.1 thioredoxin family protein [Akkermansiaceae bacterium]